MLEVGRTVAVLYLAWHSELGGYSLLKAFDIDIVGRV